jgi:hypothetical protein
MLKIPGITCIDVLSGTRLAVMFDDGSSGVVDLSKHLVELHAEVLADPNVFKHAQTRRFSVIWEEADVDVDGQWLYALANGLNPPVEAADVEKMAGRKL